MADSTEINLTEQRPTTMIVDDDDIDLMQYRRLLRSHGGFGDIVVFNHPMEALQYLAQRAADPPIDLLLLDVVMPTMSGFEFLKRAVAQVGADFARSVVMMTGVSLGIDHLHRASPHDIVKAYYKKPLGKADLDEALAMLGSLDRRTGRLTS